MSTRSIVLEIVPRGLDAPDLQPCLIGRDLRQLTYDALSPDTLVTSGAKLIIPVGLPDASLALSLICRLRDGMSSARSYSGRILVLLPTNAEPEEIALASAHADDFVIWPEPEEALRQRILKLLPPTAEEEVHRVSETLCRELGMANMVGQDPAFLRVAEMALASAQTAFSVLITGETGTGKEMLARAIHFFSDRRNRPFVPVDCAGVPDHLFENELFGHARGAYTDAHTEQRGLATMADGGTLFLDEVDSLSLVSQAKLLRFLQDRQFKPLGSERFQSSDVKVIAATNRNLEEAVAEKRFRSDLYYRLNVLHLELPPLRERPEDIKRMAQHFLTLYLPVGVRKTFSNQALQRLNSYHWPGNARELLNVVQRAIVFSRGPQIMADDLSLPTAAAPTGEFRQAREANIEVFEREYVQDVLRRNAGNITHAAREAGKERRAFGRLVKKYGLAAQARAAGQN